MPTLPVDDAGNFYLALIDPTAGTFKRLKGVRIVGDEAALAVSLDGEQVDIGDLTAGEQSKDLKVSLDGEGVVVESFGPTAGPLSVIVANPVTLNTGSIPLGTIMVLEETMPALELAIRDTLSHDWTVFKPEGQYLTLYVRNELDQPVVVELLATPAADFSWHVSVGSITVAAGSTGYYSLTEWHPNLRLRATCAEVPTTGAVYGYVSSSH